MLVKKLYRILRDFKNKNKFEIISKFMFEYRWFYIVRPKNGNIITNHSYVVPEYRLNLSADRIKNLKAGLLWSLANIDKYRGRHYIVVLC